MRLRAALVIVSICSTFASKAFAEPEPETDTSSTTADGKPLPAKGTTVGGGEPRFATDPVTDLAILGTSAGFALLLEAIIRTGELRPQEPGDPSILLPIDRPFALSDETEPGSAMLSNVWLGAAMAYAAVDAARSELTGKGEGAFAYGILYAESALVNLAVTDLAKIAVRRPRPTAYAEFRRTGMVSTDTNSALSFYSGHAALTAGLAATATYLAFERDDTKLEGWLTLVVGSTLTVLVSIERVRAREHFPTDVIAGVMAGAGIGVLVPHLHRINPLLRVSGAPIEGGAGIAIGGVW